VEVGSIGWQTDLELRRLEGAELRDLGDHVVVRTRANPGYRWGNFLLLSAGAAAGDAETWLQRFRAEFPRADHVAIGLDSPAGGLGGFADHDALGLRCESNAVLVASAPLRRPSRPPPAAELRALEGDGDWHGALGLRLAVDGEDGSGYRAFLERQMASVRRVCERGDGAWFGAFGDGEMRAGLGVFRAGAGIASIQTVDTHPAHRRQGLASYLLLAAGEHAHRRLGARELVIAADPGYFAIDIYRTLGFREVERQVQLERTGAVP
jgi:ribosomal protein S18 acetylase RimI-like enzyme